MGIFWDSANTIRHQNILQVFCKEMIYLTIAALILWLILDVSEDFGYITSNSKLWHMADAARRVLLAGYVALENYGFTNKAFIITALILSIYWIVFDMGLNRKRKLSLFYVGSGLMDLTVKWIAKKVSADHESLMLFIKGITFLLLAYLAIKHLI